MSDSSNRVMVSIRLPKKLRGKLKTAAEEDGMSQADIIAEALADWLEKRDGEHVPSDE